MDNDLIKALRCLASQNEDGECYMDLYNNANLDKQRIGCGSCTPETAPCPYWQSKYGVCFENGECHEWLNAIADMMDIFGSLISQQQIDSSGSGDVSDHGKENQNNVLR